MRAHKDANLKPINVLVPEAWLKGIVKCMWAQDPASHSTSGCSALVELASASFSVLLPRDRALVSGS